MADPVRPVPASPAAPTPPALQLRWPTPGEVLRLRCPICWQGAMFASPLQMNARCPSCDHSYDRGHGYFLGAMMFSYTIVVVFEAVLVTALRLTGLSWTTALLIGAATIPLIGPLIAFPYSRLWWVMIERRYLRWGEEEDAALRAELARRKAASSLPAAESRP